MNRASLLVLCLAAAACASAPPVAPVAPRPAGPTYEQKMSWILRLEDQRVLRDPAPVVLPAPPPPPPSKGKSGKEAPVVVVPPPPPPDLTTLVSDSEARVRRRAAL